MTNLQNKILHITHDLQSVQNKQKAYWTYRTYSWIIKKKYIYIYNYFKRERDINKSILKKME